MGVDPDHVQGPGADPRSGDAVGFDEVPVRLDDRGRLRVRQVDHGEPGTPPAVGAPGEGVTVRCGVSVEAS